MTALKNLQPLEKKIDSLKAKNLQNFNMNELIQFNSEQLFFTVMKAITMKGINCTGNEKYLIGEEKIVDLSNGLGYQIKKAKKITKTSACFQINQKLYVAGGERDFEGEQVAVGTFFSQNCRGVTHNLSQLKIPRSLLSLCGNQSRLLAIGGKLIQPLNMVEQYLIPYDRWSELPNLNFPRILSASCVLNSQKAFTFCGYDGQNYMNSIESLNLAKPEYWDIVPVDQKVKRNLYQVAVAFQSKILLFGGDNKQSVNMYIISEDGSLIEDLSSVPNIPTSTRNVAIKNGKIFATVREHSRPWVFDGVKWSQLVQPSLMDVVGFSLKMKFL